MSEETTKPEAPEEANELEVLSGGRFKTARIKTKVHDAEIFQPQAVKVRYLGLTDLAKLSAVLDKGAPELALYLGQDAAFVEAVHPADAIMLLKEGRALNFQNWVAFSEVAAQTEDLTNYRMMEQARKMLGAQGLQKLVDQATATVAAQVSPGY